MATMVKTNVVNDFGYYIWFCVDDVDAILFQAYNWFRNMRQSLMIGGNQMGGQKVTIPTTLLRTKYEYAGESLSQLTRIIKPRLKTVLIQGKKHQLIASRIYDFQKKNLICRQSAFPTVDISFEDYIARYTNVPVEDQYYLPGLGSPLPYNGVASHISDCFNGAAIPGRP